VVPPRPRAFLGKQYLPAPGAALFLACLVGASAWSLARFVSSRADVPADADVDGAAAAIIAAGVGADDVVIVAPPWSMGLQQKLGAVASLTVAADGPWDALHRGRHRRVFLYDEADSAPWLQGRLHPVLQAPAQAFGGTRLRVVDDAVAVFDFKATVGTATVSVADATGEGAVVCGRRSPGIGGGVHCAGEPARVRVAREWALVTENGADVVVVVPPADGKRLRVTWNDVPLARQMVVAAAHTRGAVAAFHGNEAAGVFSLRVLVDGQTVATVNKEPTFIVEGHRQALKGAFVGEGHRRASGADAGFVAIDVDTGAFAGRRATVTFEFAATTADKNAFAFDAFIPSYP